LDRLLDLLLTLFTADLADSTSFGGFVEDLGDGIGG
jgi:hypothetical protein